MIYFRLQNWLKPLNWVALQACTLADSTVEEVSALYSVACVTKQSSEDEDQQIVSAEIQIMMIGWCNYESNSVFSSFKSRK